VGRRVGSPREDHEDDQNPNACGRGGEHNDPSPPAEGDATRSRTEEICQGTHCAALELRLKASRRPVTRWRGVGVTLLHSPTCLLCVTIEQTPTSMQFRLLKPASSNDQVAIRLLPVS